MNEWMNELMDGWVGGWIDGWMDNLLYTFTTTKVGLKFTTWSRFTTCYM
jgi:hypothetical protein